MTGIVWAEAAVADLRELGRYLQEQHGEDAGRAETHRLVTGARWLVLNPHAGASIRGSRLRKWKPRGARNLLIYQPVHTGITVLRVRHETENWQADPLGDAR